MPKSNPNIKTIADYNSGFHDNNDTENDSPNIRTTNEQSLSVVHNEKLSSSLSSKTSNSQQHVSPSSSSVVAIPVYCIPTFSNYHEAQQLLQRIVNEFIPIIQRRKYNVLSISELCCCADGLDSSTGTGGGPNRKSRRKIHKVANNILGYNRTTWSSYRTQQQHTIHIRLRYPNNHNNFYCYEDIAGTLAHELSHCVYGPHDNKFFQLMDEIIDEHAQLMATKAMYNGTIPFTGTGQSLGSSKSTDWDSLGHGHRLGNANHSDKGVNTTTGTAVGHTLGGDRTFIQWMTPKEVAVFAAETRRRQLQLRNRGNDCCGLVCHPCDDEDDNNDSDDDDVVDDDNYDNDTTKKQKSKNIPCSDHVSSNDDSNDKCTPQSTNNNADDQLKDTKKTNAPSVRSNNTIAIPPNNVAYIDLTLDDDDDNDNWNSTSAVATMKTKKVKYIKNNNDVQQIATTYWICHRCTYHNHTTLQSCDVCTSVRVLATS